MTKSNTAEKENPYQYHQGGYSNNNMPTEIIISADIDNSYIQQNLPVRRQSLIVYHERKEQLPKRHTSLYNISSINKSEKKISCSRSFNSVHAISTATGRNKPPPLVIEHNTNSTSSTSSSGSSNSGIFAMDSLLEESTRKQQSKAPKFIGKNNNIIKMLLQY